MKKNIEAAQRKQKQYYYDAKHGSSSCFTTGSLVWKKDFLRKKRRGRKLDYKWEGPLTIVLSLGKGLFKLHCHGNNTLLPNWKGTIVDVDVPLVMLGNPAYPLLPWLMKGFPGPDNGNLTRE